MSTAEEVKLDNKTKAEIVAESCMQLIPGVGSVLASLYFGTKQAKEFARLERFYQELSDELKKYIEIVVKLEEQYTDGLISLIEQINDKVEKEHQETKFTAYKKYMKQLLINPVTKDNYDERKVYLDTLYNLSILEIEILMLLFNNRYEDGKGKNIIKVEALNRSNTPQYAIVGAVQKLKIHGLIQVLTIDLTEGVDNSLKEGICVSDYGVKFVEFCLVK